MDSTYNNERLYIDVRDDISLMQALTADSSLNLDAYTMTYLISLLRSMILTSENISGSENIPDETIRITSQDLYKLKDKILNEEKRKLKLSKKESTKTAASSVPVAAGENLSHVEQELGTPSEDEEEAEESKEEEEDSEAEETDE